MLKELLKPDIEDLIDNRAWNDLREVLSSWPSPEIADLLLDIDKKDKVLLFRALTREISSDVFSYLEYEDQDELLKALSDQETREILEDLSPDDRTALLEELPAKVTLRMLNLLSAEDLKEARLLLGYPEDSVGRRMTPDFVAVKQDWTVKQALDHLRVFGKDSETLYRVYITDKSGKLIDDILLRNIILCDETEYISKLMDFNVVALSAFDDQEKAVKVMEKYDLHALPVVDSKGLLVGIVTFDDVFDIYEEESTEDIQKLGGMSPVYQSYVSSSSFKLYQKRLPWLMALLLTSFVSASLIDHYESVNRAYLILASFIPMLIGSAGNTGTQSSTLIIRALSTGDLEYTDWGLVIKKELILGLFLGITLALVAFLRVIFKGNSFFDFALVISISMFAMITWANIIGSILPLILARFRLDPAVISNPLIATILDSTGIMIYYNVAIYLLDFKL
jgi:magnesium transporter